MPESVTALAASEGFWLPDPPSEGWSWAMIEEMLDTDDLDEMVEAIARDLGTAVIGYSVFDGDCALLVAASPSGLDSRFVFRHETFDGYAEREGAAAEISRGGAERFAAWSKSFAPVPIGASEAVIGSVRTSLIRSVFCRRSVSTLRSKHRRAPAWMDFVSRKDGRFVAASCWPA